MAINKKLLHFKKFSDFNSKKLSANEANTQYTLGVDGAVTTGSPDVLYQSICWIKDTQQQWTHGQLYDCSASEGGEENVQSDWNVTDTSSDAYIKNKPTIPAAVTVDTALSTTSTNPVQNKAVAAGINAKYTKPSAGIPKNDLATAVQNSLGKADTALQTEQYKGTVTGVKINGTTKNPDANGLVDLGEISGGSGGSSGGSGAYAEVSHGTNDTTFELTPNTFHVWDEVASLTLTLGAETSGVANEYLFQFLSGSTPTTLSLPDDLKWPDDEPLTPEADKMYQLSILKGAVSVLSWENKNIVIINFTIAGTSYQAEEGMTWAQWINSSYNTGGYYISGNIVRFDSMNRVAYQDSYGGIPPTDIIQNNYNYRIFFDD